ncbi:TonB-dependent receptor [Brevundimonas balnearis]|uniref:TonB-dependent receptor n=1 Tax=Brevundimonas balnearis TaxID=1572858 RepID=A0ABV6R7Z6_9CAUL
MSVRLGLFAGVALSGLAFAANAQDATQVDEVVVYGQKSDRAGLEDVEESLSIVSDEAITRSTAIDLYDVIRRVPNVVEVNGGRGFAIRGVQQAGPSYAGQGQTLATYVDDLPLTARQNFAGPLDVWDLEQVEVYRGPQATTFGRNALAGAIYVRTADPSFDLQAKGRVEASEHGGRQHAAAIAGPLIAGRLAGRLSYSNQETDGFNTNTFLNRPADARSAETLRGKLLFTPSDNVEVLASATWFDATRGDDLITPITNRAERQIAYDTPAVQGSEGLIGSLRVRWRLSDALELTSVTAAQTSDYIRFEDFDGSAAPIATLDRTGEDETFTQEFRLSADYGRWRGVAGLFYLTSDESYFDRFRVPITIVNPALPLTNFVSREGDFLASTETWAVFADGEIDLTDRLTLVAGLRYDNETYGTDAFQVTTIEGALPPAFEFLRAIVEGTIDDSLSTDFDAFLPKLGLKYTLTPAHTVGVTISRGYRAGGVENNIVTGERNSYDAEYLTNYEVWLRGSGLGSLTYSVNAYLADWTDQQVSVPALAGNPGLTITQNAGESRLFGVEAEGRVSLTDRLSLFAAIGYADTEFTDFPNPDGAFGGPANYNGNAFPYASKWTGALGVDWGGEVGPFVNATASFRSSSFNDVENLPENRTDASTVVDARFGWRFERAELSVFARNLFDEEYASAFSATPGADYVRLGAPRVVGVRIDVAY